ncbi:HBR330Cp [Eremothecium sinecaudum]|uniref:HBR330Cp n=1 Tax=Eremothecium sinecaudum TaxID=45286 RepID=A0A120K1D2_9SACH|nr:HBR330Cp [Eremothecium sinecaudum]AMD19231.1 HBR330Cp [Eremothecium sinecaudum]
MLVDLNIPWPQSSYDVKPTVADIDQLKRTLVTLHTLGYSHVALNFTLAPTVKLPQSKNQRNPIDLSLLEDVCAATTLKLYTRITIVLEGSSNRSVLSSVADVFDVVAVMPTSPNGLAVATASLDMDLLSFEYSKRLPAILKHKAICSCVKRGVKIEIVYSNALRDKHARKQFIINCKNVIRASRSRGLVISSGAQSPVECRNLLGVSSLVNFIGLKQDKCSKAMTELAALVLLKGRLRGCSHRETVVVGSGDPDIVNDQSVRAANPLKIVKRTHSEDIDDDQSLHAERPPKRQLTQPGSS